MESETPKSLGAKVLGQFSLRPYNPTKIGIPIRRLSSRRIGVAHHAIDVIEKHLQRFLYPLAMPERVMLNRLRKIADGKFSASAQDLNFYAHELREFARYKWLGFATGKGDDYELWNDLHTATLEDYGLRENLDDLYENPLYHWEAAIFISRRA